MARRYRPQTFSDVAAQSHITETLKRALASERVAPAYLFTGPRGSGKTTVARIVAKAVNCEEAHDGEPCAACEACRNIAEGRSLDVLEIDGASNNSVDDVRELRENVGYAASAPGKRKVYIIDEVHMLSTGAFNALLKTLEEPPAHVLFVFATTEPHKVPQTILSRCQRFDFRRLLTEEIRERLARICKQESVDIDAAALFVLAKRADGSMRDGLSLLDQVISSASGRIGDKQVAEVLGLVREEIYIDLTQAILEHDAVRALELLHAALHEGSDPSGFALGLVEHLRNLLLLSVDRELKGSVQLGEAHLERVMQLAERFRTEDILYLLNRAAQVYEDARRLSNPGVVLEVAVVELAHFESRVVLREVLERLDAGAGGSTSGKAAGTQGSSGAPAAPAGRPPGRTRGRRGEPQGGPGREEAVPPQAVSPRLAEAPGGPLAAGGAFMPPRAALASAGSGARTGAAAPLPAGGATAAAPGADATTSGSGTATAVTGPLELSVVNARWQDFTRTLRGSKAMLAQCLSDGVPASLDGSTLEVRFAAGHAFHMNLFENASTRSELEQQLQLFFGQPLHVRLRQADLVLHPGSTTPEPAGSETPATAAPGSAARLTDEDIARSRREALSDVVEGTPRLQDILDAFDAEILDERES
jgi:DNA polymerase-3 subunit gamma/tau